MPRIKGGGGYLGIDPGKSGGLASVDGLAVMLKPMPNTYGDILRYVRSSGAKFAVIEKVGGFVKGNPLSGSSMFSFGKITGALEMSLVAAGIPYEEITPQRWQKALGIPSRKPNTKTRKTTFKRGKNKGKVKIERYGGEDKKTFKRRLYAFAQKLFPGVEGLTLDTADALLISEFARRYREGKLNA